MNQPDNNLKFKPNLKKRILATLIDYGLFLLGTYVYMSYFGEPNDEGGLEVEGLKALLIPIVWFIYFVVIESINGATLGHQVLHLEILTTNRKPISFKHAIKRHLLDPIDILFYGIPAIISIKKSDKHQRLGDMWANTIVIDMNDEEQYEDD